MAKEAKVASPIIGITEVASISQERLSVTMIALAEI